MHPSDKIYVAGHNGMVGSAIVRYLTVKGYSNIITRTRSELDLRNKAAVENYIDSEKPTVVIVAAAKVGGIYANSTYPAEFIHDNLAIALNLIESSRRCGVQRLLFLGSSCIYPRGAPQPMTEDLLLTGPLEPTNEAYAIAKIAGLKLCQYYRKQYGLLYHSVMPTNLYGQGDNYHPENAHVIPALIRRFHEASQQKLPKVKLWGTGEPRREFLYIDDCAAGIFALLQMDNPPDWVNLGTGTDVTIRKVAEMVKSLTGFEGQITFEASKPDGVSRKLLNSDRLRATGWKPRYTLEEGLAETYAYFLREHTEGTLRE